MSSTAATPQEVHTSSAPSNSKLFSVLMFICQRYQQAATYLPTSSSAYLALHFMGCRLLEYLPTFDNYTYYYLPVDASSLRRAERAASTYLESSRSKIGGSEKLARNST